MKLMQFKRVGKGNGDGLIPRMRELLDAHSATFENIAGEDGIGVRKNWQGGITIYGNGTSSSEDVAGTPAMYKVVIILGWKKTSAEASWEQMTAEEVVSNPPTKLWDEFIPYDEETEEGDEYPWYAFRPTWDYPRTHA